MREIMTQNEIDADKAGWMQKRRDLITGTDLAGLLGVPGSSATKIYWEKVAGIAQPDTMAMALGRHDEAFLAELYAGEHPDIHPGYIGRGEKLEQRGLCVHDERDWQGGTFDRIEAPGGTVVEFKTTQIREGFGEPPHGEIPLRMFVQCLWQGDIKGATVVKLVVLMRPFGPFLCYWVPIDDDARADLEAFRRRAVDFRDQYLIPRIPPPADAWRDTTVTLKRIYNQVERDPVIVSSQLQRWLLAAQARRDTAQERYDELKNQLAAQMGNAGWAITRDRMQVMQRSLAWPKRIDLKRLRADFPEVAAECLVECPEDEPEIKFLVKKAGKVYRDPKEDRWRR